jgi:hypothetical protein
VVATPIAYIAVDETADLYPVLISIQEQGFALNAPPEMQSWFAENGLSVVEQPVHRVLEQLSQSSEVEERWIFMVQVNGESPSRYTAQREGLISFLATLQDPNILLITDAAQYRMLQPEILQNPTQWSVVSRQLLQDIHPTRLLMFQKTQLVGDKDRQLYSANPAWAEAIEVVSSSRKRALSQAQLKNVMVGTQFLVHLARTAGIHPAQAILMQHGLPVHVACSDQSISHAIEKVIFQSSPLTPGGTLVVSHPLPIETYRKVAQSGIQVVLATSWEEQTLSEARKGVIPVMFHLERLQISHTGITPMNTDTVLAHSGDIDARQVSWQTAQKPTEAEMLDLEIAVVLAEHLPQCATVLVHDQQTLAVSGGMVVPQEAVDYCLKREAGETLGAVCVLSGEVFSQQLFNALIQARVAGVLFLNPVDFPPEVLETLKNIPFFVGTYTETGMSQILQQVGVRHG